MDGLITEYPFDNQSQQVVDRVQIFRRASPDTYASDYFIIGINDLDNRRIMALGKQAKTLTKTQIDTVTAFLLSRRHGLRDQTVFLLSVRAGLRAKEIANLRWSMLLNPDGQVSDAIHLTDIASKGRSGRVILNSP
jgi:integrase/recombinase XerD